MDNVLVEAVVLKVIYAGSFFSTGVSLRVATLVLGGLGVPPEHELRLGLPRNQLSKTVGNVTKRFLRSPLFPPSPAPVTA